MSAISRGTMIPTIESDKEPKSSDVVSYPYQEYFQSLFPSCVGSLEICNDSLSIEPLSKVSIVRIRELSLTKDFTFHDEKAIVVIEEKLIGPSKKMSIVARNVIVCPSAELEIEKLEVKTQGASILLNVKANELYLTTHHNAVLGNSRSRVTKVQSLDGEAIAFGINLDEKIPLRKYKTEILKVLEEAVNAGASSLSDKSQHVLDSSQSTNH